MGLVFNPFTGNLDFTGSGGSSSNSFPIIQTDHGTSPTASSPTSTLDLTSSDGSVTITGNSTTDTVDFSVSTPKTPYRPAVKAVDFINNPAPTGGTSYTTDGYTAANGDRILFTYDWKVRVISGVGTSIAWTVATDGQNGDGTPTLNDEVFVDHGGYYKGMRLVYNDGTLAGNSGFNGDVRWGQGARLQESAVTSGQLELVSFYGFGVGFNGAGWNDHTGNGLRLTAFTGGPTSQRGIWAIHQSYPFGCTTSGAASNKLQNINGGNDFAGWFGHSVDHRPMMMTVHLLAYRTDIADTDALVGKFFIGLYWNGTTLSAMGTTQTLMTASMGTTTGWTVDLATNPGQITVTGVTGKTIQWSAAVEFTGFDS